MIDRPNKYMLWLSIWYSYWKWPFIVELPTKNVGFPWLFVCLPEGTIDRPLIYPIISQQFSKYIWLYSYIYIYIYIIYIYIISICYLCWTIDISIYPPLPRHAAPLERLGAHLLRRCDHRQDLVPIAVAGWSLASVLMVGSYGSWFIAIWNIHIYHIYIYIIYIYVIYIYIYICVCVCAFLSIYLSLFIYVM